MEYLDQLRAALSDPGMREQLNVSDAQWESFEQDHAALIRAVVKEVTFEGTMGAVSLTLIRCEDSHED